jgi:hypothetical protein
VPFAWDVNAPTEGVDKRLQYEQILGSKLEAQIAKVTA